MFDRSSQFTVVVSEGVVVDNFVDYEIRVKRSLTFVSSWEEGGGGLKGIRVNMYPG